MPCRSPMVQGGAAVVPVVNLLPGIRKTGATLRRR